MAAEGNGDQPVPDLRTMEELSQPSLNGRGGPIAPIAIQATYFGLNNDMIQQVQNACQFHGLPAQRSKSSSSITSSSDTEITALKGKMAEINKKLMRVLQVNQQVKAVTPNCETCGGPNSFRDCPATVGQTQNVYAAGAYQGGNSYQPQGGTFMKRHPEECYDLIENMTAHHNDDTSAQRSESSSSITSSSDTEIAALKVKMAEINKNLMRVLQVNQQVKAATSNRETCGGPHSFSDCPATANDVILKNMQTNMTSLANSILELKNMFDQFIKMNIASSLGSGTLPGNTITNPKEDLNVVERETEATKDTVNLTNNESAKDVQPPVVQTESTILTYETVNSPIIEPVASPVSAPNPNLRPSIPYPSRMQDQKLRDKANDQQVDAFLALKDDPTSSEVDQSYIDTEGDILVLEAFLNDDPSLPPPNQGNYLPEVRKELKICDDKLPVIIAKDLSMEEKTSLITVLKSHKRAIAWKLSDIKDLSVEEKTALITVLKSYKRAIAWKLSDIKGIDPEFCIHKILMEEDFEPTVQHQRRVNPKIHDVIKNEVLKLLDSGLIYPISDSPWEKSHFMVKEGIVLGHKISKNGIEVDKAKVKVIAKLPHPTTVKGDLPFELMCDASDFAISAVLGQCQEKHFRPIHYASKIMIEADSNYTITKKEMLAVVFQGEIAPLGSVPPRVHIQSDLHKKSWEPGCRSSFPIRKPASKCARPKEISKSFPLETLNMVSSRGNSSTPWFTNFANYHARNFVVKAMSSQ
nr:DNA-directed DNA polymerase [Tanacetum cinerariifolium]